MRTKLITGCTAALASLLFVQGAQAVPVGVLNAAGQYTGINGLDVSGTLYDVTFKDGTFASALGGTLDFTTSSTAAAAATAIFSALFSPLTAMDADPNLTFGCQSAFSLLACYIITPYANISDGTMAITMRNGRESQLVQNGNSDDLYPVGFTSNFTDTQAGAGYVWADWTPAGVVVDPTPVPEPTTLALLAAGLIACGRQLRRRRN